MIDYEAEEVVKYIFSRLRCVVQQAQHSGVDVYRYMLDQGFRIVHVEKCRRKTTCFPSLRGETFKYIYFHYSNEHQNPNRLR